MRDAERFFAVRAGLNRRHDKARSLLGWLVIGLMACGAGNALAQAPDRCARVQPGGDIHFRGKTLRETPEIATPEIRRINALVSHRCYDEAKAALQSYMQEHPDDYQARYAQVRMRWIFEGDTPGRQAMLDLLKEHPDFASVKVLLASWYLSAGELDQTKKLLDELVSANPNAVDNLWLFMDRLKMDAIEKSETDTAKQLMEILNNAEFPPSAREASAVMIFDLLEATPEQKEAAHRAQLTFESATPMNLKVYNLAVYLYKDDQARKSGELIELVKKLKTDPDNQSKLDGLNFMLSVAYLKQAAAIDTKPTRLNADLIRLATEATDAKRLRAPLEQLPQFADLAKLLVPPTDPAVESK